MQRNVPTQSATRDFLDISCMFIKRNQHADINSTRLTIVCKPSKPWPLEIVDSSDLHSFHFSRKWDRTDDKSGVDPRHIADLRRCDSSVFLSFERKIMRG